MSPLSLLNRPGLFGCALLAALLAVCARAESPADAPNFHAFLAEVAEQATAVEIRVSGFFPQQKKKSFRIYQATHPEDINALIKLITPCQEPPIKGSDDAGLIVLTPFPPPEFRYTITFKHDADVLLSLWIIDRSVLQGLPSPWHHQARFEEEAGMPLMEFLRREQAFSPGAPQPSGRPSL